VGRDDAAGAEKQYFAAGDTGQAGGAEAGGRYGRGAVPADSGRKEKADSGWQDKAGKAPAGDCSG